MEEASSRFKSHTSNSLCTKNSYFYNWFYRWDCAFLVDKNSEKYFKNDLKNDKQGQKLSKHDQKWFRNDPNMVKKGQNWP